VPNLLQSFRVYLGTDNLEEYFTSHPTDIEDLLKLSSKLVTRYLTTEASERALYGDGSHGFAIGSPWPKSADVIAGSDSESEDEPLEGDQILANTILRMRDSMLHYEFQFAIADGDIGRALNVMAVCFLTLFPSLL
jgi:hypothetical protein